MMTDWTRDRFMRQLVTERAQGDLSRRRFLEVLGGTGAAVAGAVAGKPREARAQKNLRVTVWDKERSLKTRAVLTEIARDFQRLHPDIEVRSEGQPGGTVLLQKLTAALAVKTPPTVALTEPALMPRYQAAGVIEPIDDVVAAVGKDRIFPHLLPWMEFAGRYYGLTHAWTTRNLGGRGDFAKQVGVDPTSWKTWGDWLRDLPKLNKPPDYYALDNCPIGTDFWDTFSGFLGSNGGRVLDDAGNPVLDSPQVLEVLEFWRALRPYLPPGWPSHKYTETLAAWAGGKAAQVYTFGRTVEFIEEFAPADKRSPEVFQMWPLTIGPSGKEPLTALIDENWCVFSNTSKAEQDAGREFLKFFYKRENYLKYTDSVPLHLLPIFKDTFQDADFVNHPLRRKWKAWLSAQEQWVVRGRATPTFIFTPKDRLIPWVGPVGQSSIISDMVMAVTEKGSDPRAAAKQANERIQREIIDPSKRP